MSIGKLARVAIPAAVALATVSGVLAQDSVGQVNGTVFDKDRKEVPGLSVAAISATGSIYGTSTDDGGRYAFKGLEASTYSVILMLPNGAAARKENIRVRPLFRSIVDFNLVTEAAGEALPAVTAPGGGDAAAPALRLEASMIGVDRRPTPDASLTLTPTGGAGAGRRASTDPDGRCALDDVPAGTYRITARAPGFITWSLGPLPLDGKGRLKVSLLLVPFPLGFDGTLEDKLIPSDPIAPPKQ